MLLSERRELTCGLLMLVMGQRIVTSLTLLTSMARWALIEDAAALEVVCGGTLFIRLFCSALCILEAEVASLCSSLGRYLAHLGSMHTTCDIFICTA